MERGWQMNMGMIEYARATAVNECSLTVLDDVTCVGDANNVRMCCIMHNLRRDRT